MLQVDPEMKRRMAELGADMGGGTAEEFARFVAPRSPASRCRRAAARAPSLTSLRRPIDFLHFAPPRTLFDKIWARHVVARRDDGQTLLYVDRHLLQDGSAPAFELLRQRGLQVRSPDRAFATPDHYVPTDSRELAEHRRPRKPRDGGGAAGRQRGGRHPLLRPRRRAAGHRPRRRARAGADACPACCWCAATATPRPMARSARWPSASAPPRSRMCWPPRPCGSASRKTHARHRRRAARRRRHRQGRDPGHHRAGSARPAAPAMSIEYAGSAIRGAVDGRRA